MNTTTKAPFLQRINFRIVVFAGVMLVLIGYPIYLFLDVRLSGGVWDVKDERGTYKRVDLKTISDFEMDQMKATNEDIPSEFRRLDGERVMLIGEIVSGRSARGRQSD